jgi:hypothetical protein
LLRSLHSLTLSASRILKTINTLSKSNFGKAVRRTVKGRCSMGSDQEDREGRCKPPNDSSSAAFSALHNLRGALFGAQARSGRHGMSS